MQMSFHFPFKRRVIERLMTSNIQTWCQRWPAARWTGHTQRSQCWWVGSGSSYRAVNKDLRTGAEGWRSSLQTQSGSATPRDRTSMSYVKTMLSHGGKTSCDTYLQSQECTKIPRWYVGHRISELDSSLLWDPDVGTWFSLLLWSIVDLIYRQHLYYFKTCRFNQSGLWR